PLSLLSFPTRRSSDLVLPSGAAGGLPALNRDTAKSGLVPSSVPRRAQAAEASQSTTKITASTCRHYTIGPLPLPSLFRFRVSQGDRKSTRLNSSHVKI